MLNRLTRSFSKLGNENALAFAFPPSDFIPLAGFYDADTLITKNGELLKTIRVSARKNGLINEEGAEDQTLRSTLRRALTKHIPHERFSFWVHTRRNKQAVPQQAAASIPFAQAVHDRWMHQHSFTHVYHNVCYVTVIVQGQATKLFDAKEFKQTGSIERNRAHRQDYLDRAAEELAEVASSLLADLSHEFQADVLSISERGTAGEPIAYSEQLEWFSELTSLHHQAVPITDNDVSNQLHSHELVFGFNALEARGKGSKRFASMVTIKHYHEMPFTLLDRILQLPCEMVITQALDFVPAKEATLKTREWADVFQMSQDGLIANATGTVSMLEAHKDKPTDYVRQQIMIMVLTDDFAELEEATAQVQDAIAKLGLVSIREDLRLEEVFWAQLPGNFAFLKRQHPMPFNKAAGLARLNYFPIGDLRSKWGGAITVFPTSTATPYLFHFHQGENGHTAFLDYNSFPDRVGHRLLHFVLTEASRLTARIIVIDNEQASRMWVQSMQGKYMLFGGTGGIKINPFALADDKRNRGFLAAWIAHMLDVAIDNVDVRTALKLVVDQVVSASNASQRSLEEIAVGLHATLPQVAERLAQLAASSEVAAWLTRGEDQFSLNNPIVGIGLPSTNTHAALVHHAFPYILHRLVASLDGAPTILVLREGFELLENPFVAPRLASLLEMLKEQNVVVIFQTRNVENIPKYSVTPVIMENTATSIYMPDDIDMDYLPQITGLTPALADSLARMQRQNGDFLIRHEHEFIPASFRFDAELNMLDALSGDEKPAVLARKG